MKKILIFLTAIFLSVGAFGQDLTSVNKRIMLDTLNTKIYKSSASRMWDDIFLDTASVINFHNGDITATHSDGTLTFAGGNIVLPSTTSVGDVSATEISYVNGVTSAIQTQLNNKADTAGAIDLEEFLLFDASTDTLATRAYARSEGGGGGGLSAEDVAAQINDTIEARLLVAEPGLLIADTADMLDPYFTEPEIRKADSDTIPIFVFGAGSGGVEADTALFTATNIYGVFYNDKDTIIATSLRAVMIAGTTPLGTDTLAIQVFWNDSINVVNAPTARLNTAYLPITSITVGTEDTSFDTNIIPPGVWVFCKSTAGTLGRKPKALYATLYGFKRNRSY